MAKESATRKTFFITTPIYYPSDRLHIGHAYTTTAADAIARWQRFNGRDVFFLTGSDDHGQKIERAAKAKGKSPREYVDEIVATFKVLWERLGISYDEFIRTTEERHVKVVQEIFRRLYENGDIYKSAYEGWYCTPCETFWSESRLVDGNCPDCGRSVEWLQEESYFFRMSRYADRLLAHIEANPDFIQPDTRRNEMISFIKSGLEDLCVSRTTFSWGIPVPFDPKHVVYVWIDALANYITAAGYLQDEERFARVWPADLHLVGKDILRFHTIIWPIVLMALDIPLPRKVYGHGWLLVDEGKMSKSKGNVVDPLVLMDEFGVDPIRYFLLREVPFGQDAKFSRTALIDRINADLANDLGNLLYRSLAMMQRYFDGVVPAPDGDGGATGSGAAGEDYDGRLRALAAETVERVGRAMERLELNQALIEIWRLVGGANKYLDDTQPWALARQGDKARLARVMYHVLEVQRIVALLLQPFMPSTAEKIWNQLGMTSSIQEARISDTAWGGLPAGAATRPGDPLFPRIEEDEDEEEDEGGDGAAGAQPDGTPGAAAGAGSPGQEKAQAQKAAEGKGDGAVAQDEGVKGKEEITIDEFARLDLRVAKVVDAGHIPGADKLLKLQVDVGGERRQIVAGIKGHYEPEALVGRSVVIVANLKPAKLRGEISQGMVLAAEAEDGTLGLIAPDPERPIPPGSTVR